MLTVLPLAGMLAADIAAAQDTDEPRQANLVEEVVVIGARDVETYHLSETLNIAPDAAKLLKKAAGVPKGSGTPNTEKVGKVTRAQLEEIATTKMVDLNANNMDAAVQIIAGTARSMGLDVEG